MSSRAILEGIPRIVRRTARLVSHSISHRCFASGKDDVAESAIKAGKAVTGSESKKAGTSARIEAPRKDSSNGSKQQKKYGKTGVDPKDAAAAAIASKKDNEENEYTVVSTRLYDNHPLQEQDQDIRSYLHRLSEDELDEQYPLFPEECDSIHDDLPTVVKYNKTDRNGNTVVEEVKYPSKHTQELAEIGYTFVDRDSYGGNFDSTVTVGNIGKYQPKRSGDDEFIYDGDTPEHMDKVGDRIRGTYLHPGSDISREQEQNMMTHAQYAMSIRRQRREIERGYDNSDTKNSKPWMDTHRIEAIDERLHQLHVEREQGKLDYPIEKDAAQEVQRIKKEEAKMYARIGRVLGIKESDGVLDVGDRHLYQKTERKPYRITGRGKKVYKEEKEKPLQMKHIERNDLDKMEVKDIPVELLYQARHQELAYIQSRHYEDYDLNYLLNKSGKEMKNKEGDSLYTMNHGYTLSSAPISMEQRKNPISNYKQITMNSSNKEKAALGQAVILYNRYGHLTSQQAQMLYDPYTLFITPEMEKCYDELIDEQGRVRNTFDNDDMSNPSASSSGTNGIESFMKNEEEEDWNGMLKPQVVNVEKGSDDGFDTVSEEMMHLKRDDKKPLEDYETGSDEKGNLVFAVRQNRQFVPDFSRDKQAFYDKVSNAINTTVVGEKEVEEAKKTVLTRSDFEEGQRSIGMADDTSRRYFYRRYIKNWKKQLKHSGVIEKMLTELNMNNSAEVLKELGLDTEDGIEEYLMGTFDDHLKPERQRAYPPEVESVINSYCEFFKLDEEFSKMAEAEYAAQEGKKGEEEKKEGEEKKGEGEGEKKEGEKEEGKDEAKPVGERTVEPLTEEEITKLFSSMDSDMKDVLTRKGYLGNEEKKENTYRFEKEEEANDSTVKEGDEVYNRAVDSLFEEKEKEKVDPEEERAYNEFMKSMDKERERDKYGEDVEEAKQTEEGFRAFYRMEKKRMEDEERAEEETPSPSKEVKGVGHIVDALEYSNQVYVPESNRQVIMKMYKQGIHPKEIADSFGYDLDRMYALLRLMQGREERKKQNCYSEEALKYIDEHESVWRYEYRDHPPADMKKKDERMRNAKFRGKLPQFVFLKDGDDEAKVMRQIDIFVRDLKKQKDNTIERPVLKPKENCKSAAVKAYSHKLAVLDISKGSKKKVLLVSDKNGNLRECSEEEMLHRSWNRHQLRDSERLLRMRL